MMHHEKLCVVRVPVVRGWYLYDKGANCRASADVRATKVINPECGEMRLRTGPQQLLGLDGRGRIRSLSSLGLVSVGGASASCVAA
jgi:hypothetical protein